ncbi:cytochrome c biogenesis protein CcsA [Roseivirga misakiensis]|uniref:Cytochrome C biogenesis protein n=1 Tax=Roseivirga misakiensis TaxID=1563681 RepID=A0A1E5T623_9BACT|nr:cytochrome c biogenesis protein CcsA [Roseivirga misakiensis]OEK06798.1 cytochrome C biogenesis protein [Roseivirga misakiensis]
MNPEPQTLHLGIGNAGHLFVIISFISSILASFAYGKAAVNNEIGKAPWVSFGRKVFIAHGLAVIATVVVLFLIIYNHYFEYHYAWSHSSVNLAVHYMIACFWEGQEGSFLIWTLWNALLGFVLIGTNKKWEAPVMTIFSLVQAFLTSMILGVVFGDFKLGSSPFILMRDVMPDIEFLINPNFVPEDGTGLNPLLQNYWMVIHPPLTFLGFALTLVPFSFCLAGLWRRDFTDWIRPALPWTILGGVVLGTAIIMGAYWAYETLNFGGYWNWDPVENAVYVPWLVLIASMHTMIVYKKSETALKTSIVLVISTFLLILYATFLTRSGILGNTSVHSFTDLGLSGQLLIYMFFFIIGSIALSIIRWKEIPTSEKEATTYSREFWIFIGALTLCLMSFQVIVPTSFPVINKIVEGLGGISSLAPPANQIEFYSQWQLWFAVGIAILSGTGQFFYWRKMDREKLKAAMAAPILISLILSAAIFTIQKIFEPTYILLLVASTYSVVSNGKILLGLLKSKSYKLTGGSVAHIGIAMMLIGIMFSEGYSRIISQNTTQISDDLTEKDNSENIILFLNDPKVRAGYQLLYKNEGMRSEDVPGYINKSLLRDTQDPHYKVAVKPIVVDGKTYAQPEDTLYFRTPENTYHEIEFTSLESGKKFTRFPRIQKNETMGRPVQSPSIEKQWNRDLYTFVQLQNDFEEEYTEWSEKEIIRLDSIGQRFFINDYVAEYQGFERIPRIRFADLGPNDIAVRANIVVFAENGIQHLIQPIFAIVNYDIDPGRPFELNQEIAARVRFENINPDDDTIEIAVQTTQKDWVIVQIVEKPHINILWIGTIIMIIGFIIATRRRYVEFIKMRDKGMA